MRHSEDGLIGAAERIARDALGSGEVHTKVGGAPGELDESFGDSGETVGELHGDDDLLHLVVEIKGYRREDAVEKKSTMDSYWVPGVNHLGSYGRWAFAEFTEVYQIEADFAARVEGAFNKMIESATAQAATGKQ